MARRGSSGDILLLGSKACLDLSKEELGVAVVPVSSKEIQVVVL
jgi:hypothetical protein